MAIIVGISVVCLEIPCHFWNLTNDSDFNSNINMLIEYSFYKRDIM